MIAAIAGRELCGLRPVVDQNDDATFSAEPTTRSSATTLPHRHVVNR
jgi:hypothetical protein